MLRVGVDAGIAEIDGGSGFEVNTEDCQSYASGYGRRRNDAHT